jgi:hypothetical protein
MLSGQVTIGTASAAQIGTASASNSRLHVHNNDNTKTIYLGGPAVTSTTGMALFKEDSIDIDLAPGERLFGISSGADHVISWMQQVL